jgi:hypothetical protein
VPVPPRGLCNRNGSNFDVRSTYQHTSRISRHQCSHFDFKVRISFQSSHFLHRKGHYYFNILQIDRTNKPRTTTMSNYNVPTNTSGRDEEEYGEEDNLRAACIALVLILIMLACIVCAAYIVGRRDRLTQELSAPAAERQKEKDEKRKQRKEWISKNLIVKEWSPDDATVETKTSGENLTTDKQLVLGSVPQTSDRVSCELGTDDYESFLEEAAGCAICLSHFKPHQLVCESNNLSCGHVFHQDCMMGWLMKHRMCPLCREVYLLKTV